MTSEKNITIKDIAREAGVSVATVSRVVNNKNIVERETKERVLKIIGKYNFTPNIFAKGLVSKSRKNIGLIFPYNENMLDDLYLTEITYYIEKNIIEYGYDFSLFFTHNENIEELGNQYLNLFNSGKVDGLIIGGVQLKDDSLKPLISKELPFFLIGSSPSYLHYNFVDVDHKNAVKETILSFYKNKKMRKIIYFGSSPLFSATVDKLYGFKDAIAEHGIRNVEKFIFSNINSYRDAYELVEDLINQKKLPELFFCDHDMIAWGVINALLYNNIKVPDDISVVGYNDIKIAKLFYPSLSTIRLPIEDMAKYTVASIIKLMTKKNKLIKKKIFQGKFVKRWSSM